MKDYNIYFHYEQLEKKEEVFEKYIMNLRNQKGWLVSGRLKWVRFPLCALSWPSKHLQ
jgi:hypothetical protein